MQDLQDLGEGEVNQERAAQERRAQTFPLSVPKPIIAAINGPCAGIGLVQALMCDMRFAAEGAKLTTAFARRGLVAEHGISWVLPRLVGPARALDLLLSGRVVLAQEAAQMGLVNRALAPEVLLDETLAYARDVAVNCSPASMATMKRQVYAALETPCPVLGTQFPALATSFASPLGVFPRIVLPNGSATYRADGDSCETRMGPPRELKRAARSPNHQKTLSMAPILVPRVKLPQALQNHRVQPLFRVGRH